MKLDKRRHFEGLLKSCQSWGASDTAALDKELPTKLGFVESLMSLEMAGKSPMNWSIAGNNVGKYRKIYVAIHRTWQKVNGFPFEANSF